MHPYFSSYKWKKGIPYGVEKADYQNGVCYKIVKDPYRVHISLEVYENGVFKKTLYDSKIFNFSHLKEEHQHGWQKEVLFETVEEKKCLIRNLEGRVVLIETYLFEGEICKECQIYSPHGFFLGREKIFMQKKGDLENKVSLFDPLGVPVMEKIYETDAQGEFVSVKEEIWEL